MPCELFFEFQSSIVVQIGNNHGCPGENVSVGCQISRAIFVSVTLLGEGPVHMPLQVHLHL